MGIIGVALGTLVAMLIRAIELIYHASKYILCRNVWYTFKRMMVIVFEVLIISVVLSVISTMEIVNYADWILQSVIVFSICCIIVVGVNIILYYGNFKNMIKKNVQN